MLRKSPAHTTLGGDGDVYEDVPGFCKSATLEEIQKHGHVLTPGRYVGAAPQEDDGEPFQEEDVSAHLPVEGTARRSSEAGRGNRSQLRKVGFLKGDGQSDFAGTPSRQDKRIEILMAHVAENGCNQEWVHCRLADACSAINYGLTASATDTPTGQKFLRITDIVSGVPKWDSVPYVSAEESEQEKYQLFNGDIVVARTGASTGVSAFIKDPPQALFASYLVRLQTKPEFDPRFVSYYLKSAEFWTFIKGVLGDKSAQPNASASTMTSAPFRAPRNLSDQQDIAHVLGTLDDKAELNRRMNRTLEEMARAIFQDWFVDFGPTRGQVGWAGTLPPIGAMGTCSQTNWWTRNWGRFPEGWEVEPLGEIIELAYAIESIAFIGSMWVTSTTFWSGCCLVA